MEAVVESEEGAIVADVYGCSGWEVSLQFSKENNLTVYQSLDTVGICLRVQIKSLSFMILHHEEKGGGTEQIEKKHE